MELHENPLVPNKKMRQMYMAMAEARGSGRLHCEVAANREGPAEAGIDARAGGIEGQHDD